MLPPAARSGRLDPDALFFPFAFPPSGTVIAAVSGGGDSSALLLLLHRHLERRFPGTRLLAATVDHGLREGSATEAAAVAAFAARLGREHRTLPWLGSKPATGIQAAARNARLALLGELARRETASAIVLGHTQDDQAETVRMRLARGTGRGLAGMAPATLVDGHAWLLRPLLTTRRATLRAFLSEENVAWSDDPSNEDRRFERVRVREAGEDAEALGLAHAVAAEREVAGRGAALLMGRSRRIAPGLFRAEREILDPATPFAPYALRMMLAAIGGRAYLPDEAQTAGFIDCLRAVGSATLSGTAATLRRDGLYLHRERRGIVSIRARTGAVFDGRFTVRDSLPGVLTPGDGEQDFEALAEESAAPRGLLRAALSTAPFFQPDPGTSAPEWRDAIVPRVAPFASLMPVFDHAPASAFAQLLGAAPPPAPPYRRPIGGVA
ncbi:MAG: tRNA lysidine(34) synthetase TilS [Mesorhizobium amorphae]|nr:MAG: tRNA lysidine(34) synthetase TilS [Mesorhizobium amorphae]